MTKQAQIKVFVTKTFKFRAKINNYVDPQYEVTIGGESWKNGRGSAYKGRILNKIKLINERLIAEFEYIKSES